MRSTTCRAGRETKASHSTPSAITRPGAAAVEQFFDAIPHPAERTKIASGNAEALFRLA
jgi:hypothetical protein